MTEELQKDEKVHQTPKMYKQENCWIAVLCSSYSGQTIIIKSDVEQRQTSQNYISYRIMG